VDFADRRLPADPDVIAPDGSEVRILASVAGGSSAEFRLGPGEVSIAMRHRSVDEIWFVLEGSGELWRRGDADESVVALDPGVSLTIPCGTQFQFRAHAGRALRIFGVTMPPWPGAAEAVEVPGRWEPSVRPPG
jgi:mannose-6-phosphate isomerase-like protein (cupin superfamily)